jgi:hypothetical protein
MMLVTSDFAGRAGCFTRSGINRVEQKFRAISKPKGNDYFKTKHFAA